MDGAVDKLGKLTWPTPASDLPKADAVSMDDLLLELHLISTEEDHKEATKPGVPWDEGTPESVQVITAGTLAITKSVRKWLIAAGGVTGGIALIAEPILNSVWKIGTPLTITIIAGVALFVSALAIALAMVVSADLKARSHATAARYSGRAEVASAFLRATANMPGTASEPKSIGTDFLTAYGAHPNMTRVTTLRHPEPLQAIAVSRTSEDSQLQVLLEDGEWIKIGEINMFTTA